MDQAKEMPSGMWVGVGVGPWVFRRLQESVWEHKPKSMETVTQSQHRPPPQMAPLCEPTP